MENYIVYSENWKKSKKFTDLEAACAYRHQQYGYAGYIVGVNAEGEEINNYS